MMQNDLECQKHTVLISFRVLLLKTHCPFKRLKTTFSIRLLVNGTKYVFFSCFRVFLASRIFIHQYCELKSEGILSTFAFECAKQQKAEQVEILALFYSYMAYIDEFIIIIIISIE